MALKTYGVLRGSVTGCLPEADDDHYQVLVQIKQQKFRLAVNVKSQLSPSDLLYLRLDKLPAPLAARLLAVKAGWTKLKSQPGGLAQDFVRGGLVDETQMVALPPDKPGKNNDLREAVDEAVGRAIAEPKAEVFAFGAGWGPETNKKDKYFRFKPGQGVHDIHMNQGSSGQFKKDNGVYQDGCLMFYYPGAKQWTAIFLAFQSQSFKTDAQGNPVAAAAPPKRKPARKTRAAAV